MNALWTSAALVLAYFAWKVAISIPDLLAWVQLERLPQAPRKLVTGHWQPGRVMQNPHLRWLAWHKELGGLFCSRLLWRHMVIIADPVIAEQLIQIDKGRQIDKLRGPYKNFQILADPDHPSMFTSPTDTYWHTVRKGLAPAFNTANIRQGFGNIADLMETVVAFLHAQGPEESLDVDLIAARVALDAISRTGFGYEMGCCRDLGAAPEATPYVVALDSGVLAMRKWILAPWVLRYLSFLPVARKDGAAIQRLRQLNTHLLQQLRAKPPPASTLGAHMLKLVDPATGKPMSDKQLLGEITIMYVAGWDTSAHTIAFTCGLISQHAEVEDKIAQELDGLGLLASESNPHPRQITHDDLALLTYTSAVIKESMRMFPVGAFGTARTSKQPLEVGGHWLPANTPCILNFYAMFNSPFYWDQPEIFSPERWLEPGCEYMPSTSRPNSEAHSGPPKTQRLSDHGAAEDTAHLSSSSSNAGQRTKRFFPFSEGMRNCIGQNLARMTVLTFVAVLCSNFKLRMADKMGGLEGMRASQRMNLTLKPGDGMFLHYIPRAPQPSTAKL